MSNFISLKVHICIRLIKIFGVFEEMFGFVFYHAPHVMSFFRWEVLGNLQYLFSTTGTLLEEVEDTKLYSVEISLNTHHLGKIVARLPPKQSSCWIYGVFVKILPKTGSKQINQHFDIGNINNLLSASSNLSTNAEKFKNLFDSFQSAGPTAVEASLMTSGLAKSNSETSSDSGPDLKILKFYIDSKFKELEQKLFEKIEENHTLQQHKLDQILTLLQSNQR